MKLHSIIIHAFVEQYPYIGQVFATFPFRLPEQVIIGIESSNFDQLSNPKVKSLQI